MKVMTQLHRCTFCRNFVVFPICVREYNDSAAHSELVFPNMVDYKIGLPDSEEHRLSFLGQLKIAVGHFHAAGVVHYDLFLSNIMWREVSTSEVKIKVIDWDAAHFLRERLPAETARRLSGRRDDILVVVVSQMRSTALLNLEEKAMFYDLSFLRVLELYLNDESLRAREKSTLDKACKDVQSNFLQTQLTANDRV
jgi:serine/threonine protein kinase